MEKGMKKRWISLYVENQVGVLSKISGLFSGKSYNLDSLTVGTTEDPTVSRMTIATVSDDETFIQIKKQDKQNKDHRVSSDRYPYKAKRYSSQYSLRLYF